MADIALPASVPMIERLVAFDTTSRHSNLPMIEFIAGWLERRGVTVTLCHNGTGDKANLIAEFGPREAPAIIVSGHSDVVPADDQNWQITPPFTPRRHRSRLYGRGTADMKGFVGVALTRLTAWHQRHRSRHGVILALSFDEEVGCQGAPLMLPVLARQRERLRGVIIGEPTEMRVATAHKGHVGLRAVLNGVGGHSGYPERGINAIDLAADVLLDLRQLAKEKRQQDLHDVRFDPPWSTVHVGTIHGGTVLNRIPERCEMDIEMRCLPNQRVEELREYLQRLYPPSAVGDPLESGTDASRPPGCLRTGSHDTDSYDTSSYDTASHSTASLPRSRASLPKEPPSPAGSATVATQAGRTQRGSLKLESLGHYPALDERRREFPRWIADLAGSPAQPMALGFGCEGGLFAQLGAPTVICGPGSIHQAHRPDEYITFEQVIQCEQFFTRLLAALAFPIPGSAEAECT
ncbi:M20/M25/M40 family metallo-hydrolase [Halomonas denitrificans]|uniref:M20/M25/M40 family metallo-hydrolase n=1 Tax=Halomonas denitrificans TaxID=370769 RepID=UPI001C9910A9|nr:M20/M25/M40 family metallo-hydrolase [Halomonas denitrificans]MBY5969485.1 M20/M25/M40 family metallo-hydrolase [Halomonas denitrificans]